MIRCRRCGASYEAGEAACSHCQWQPDRLDGFIAWSPETAAGGTALAPAAFRMLADAEERHFWFRARNRVITATLAKFHPGLRSFLEIGCGTGVVLSAIRAQFPAANLTGTELSTAGLSIAATRVPGARFMQMDGLHVPFENEFDVVGAFDVLEHIEDDRRAIAEIWKAVAPGGGAIVSVPQHPWLWSAVDEYGGHYRRYTRDALAVRLTSAGFVVERMTSFMTAVLPVMALARLVKRDPKTIDPAGELKIGSAANALMGALCAMEQRALDRDWSMPAGGSLLAFARKAA